jgi:hypothetical protein
MGGGRLLRSTARSTLGDGLVVGTLVSGVASNRGRSTLGKVFRCPKRLASFGYSTLASEEKASEK